MTEHYEKLKAAVAELESELRSVEALDEPTRAVLQEAVAEIQAALETPAPANFESGSLSDRLRRAVHDFEGSHPTLTGILSRLIDGLAQMGI
jgi:signal transduction histidine kinase